MPHVLILVLRGPGALPEKAGWRHKEKAKTLESHPVSYKKPIMCLASQTQMLGMELI